MLSNPLGPEMIILSGGLRELVGPTGATLPIFKLAIASQWVLMIWTGTIVLIDTRVYVNLID